jgi:hypothetical protein
MFKRKKSLYLAIIFTISFLSCKKDSGQDNSTISSPFTVKYEVTADKPLVNGGSFQYTNSANGLNVDLNTTLPYTKTVTVTSTNRPYLLLLYGTGIQLNSTGNVTGKIFINGIEKASVTIPANNALFGGAFLTGPLDVKYTVQ